VRDSSISREIFPVTCAQRWRQCGGSLLKPPENAVLGLSYLNERYSLVLNSHFWSYPRTNFKLVVEKVGIMW
jgi:hypothetical protein